MFASLAKSVTFDDIISWWYMPVNILLTFLIGGLLGWIVVKLTGTPRHLSGLVVGNCCSGRKPGESKCEEVGKVNFFQHHLKKLTNGLHLKEIMAPPTIGAGIELEDKHQDLRRTNLLANSSQTPWMREMMVKHFDNSIIAMDSTFSTNKYGYELYTLLIFDEQEAGVPISWAISSRNKVEDINEWLIEVYKRAKQYKEDWHVNSFMTDDASAEIEAIRLSFGCRVLLCIWHVRKAWLKNVYRYVNDKDVATRMFDRLGEIMYAMSDNEDITSQLIKKFKEEFKEEKNFINYFQKAWCHNEGRIDVTSLVNDDDVRGNFSHENNTIDNCTPLEDQELIGHY